MTDASDLRRCAEFDCCECGRHIVQICGSVTEPPLCGACLVIPGWLRIPAFRAALDPGGHIREPTSTDPKVEAEIEATLAFARKDAARRAARAALPSAAGGGLLPGACRPRETQAELHERDNAAYRARFDEGTPL